MTNPLGFFWLVVLGACVSCGTTASVADPLASTLDGVEATLVIPASAQAGANISIEISLRNTSSRAAEIVLGGLAEKPYFGIEISNSAGDPIVRLLNSATTLRIANLRRLAPGEVVKFNATIPLPGSLSRSLPPGIYFARGHIEGVPTRVTDRKPLTVLP